MITRDGDKNPEAASNQTGGGGVGEGWWEAEEMTEEQILKD